jgi:hypothetical protein
MFGYNTFGAYANVIPLLAPVDIADTNTVSGYVDLKNVHNCFFQVYCGLLTSATAADYLPVTMEAATAVDGAEAQIDFKYRKVTAAGTNVAGAITSASVVTLYASVDDGILLLMEVDVDNCAASDYRYVRVRGNPTDLTACLISIVAVTNPRYRMTTMTSATASASA